LLNLLRAEKEDLPLIQIGWNVKDTTGLMICLNLFHERTQMLGIKSVLRKDLLQIAMVKLRMIMARIHQNQVHCRILMEHQIGMDLMVICLSATVYSMKVTTGHQQN